MGFLQMPLVKGLRLKRSGLRVGPQPMTSSLIRRGGDAEGHREDHGTIKAEIGVKGPQVKEQMPGATRSLKGQGRALLRKLQAGRGPADTLILDFRPPE